MGSENGKARFCVSYGDSEITDSRDVNWDSLEMSFVFHGPFFNCFNFFSFSIGTNFNINLKLFLIKIAFLKSI